MTRLQQEMNRAADDDATIDALRAEIALLKRSVEAQKHVLGERTAEISRLRAALKPFAEGASAYAATPDGYTIPVAIGACRAAAAALEGK